MFIYHWTVYLMVVVLVVGVAIAIPALLLPEWTNAQWLVGVGAGAFLTLFVLSWNEAKDSSAGRVAAERRAFVKRLPQLERVERTASKAAQMLNVGGPGEILMALRTLIREVEAKPPPAEPVQQGVDPAKLEAAERRAERLQQELRRKTTELTQAKTQLSVSIAQAEGAEQHLAGRAISSEKQQSWYQQRLQDGGAEISTLEQQLESKVREIDSLGEQLKTAKQKASNASGRLAQFRRGHEQKSKEIARLSGLVADSSRQLSALRVELKDEQRKDVRADNERGKDELEHRNRELEQERDALKSRIDAAAQVLEGDTDLVLRLVDEFPNFDQLADAICPME